MTFAVVIYDEGDDFTDCTYFYYNDKFKSYKSDSFLHVVWVTDGDKDYCCYDLMPDSESLFAFRTISGCGRVRVNGNEYILAQNTVFVAKRSEIEFYRTDGERWNFYLFDFKVNTFEGILFENIQITENELSVIDDICNAITSDDLSLCQSGFLYLYNKWCSASKTESLSYAKQIARYIDTLPINADLSTEEIHKKFAVCERTLREHFKKQFNMTPKDYITKRRYKIAKILLTSTDFKIKEISEKTGFKNEYYFSSSFKKEFGIYPSEYRKIKRD